jgi:hypothetical protein
MAFKSDGYRTVNEIMQVAANCYVGQIVMTDANAGGTVEPAVAAAAGPDSASRLVGPVNSVVTSPTYDSTYKGDLATYDTTQATQVANDPVGACLVRVDILFPGDIVCFPIVKDTMGTAPERKAATTTVTDGLTFVTDTVDTTVSNYSSAYCSKGTNRGVIRKITTAGTTTQTVLVAFPYDIAIGDEFVIVNLKIGETKWDFDTQIQGVDSSIPYTSNYYWGFCHSMELQKSGEEKAYITIGARHLATY